MATQGAGEVTTLVLSPDQSAARDQVLDWYGSRQRKPLLTLGGYAGCGKTTTLGAIGHAINGRIAYVCYTGKASLVLRTKLAGVLDEDRGDYCGTIHGLIYEPGPRVNGAMTWRKVKDRGMRYDLIVIDEGSMVDSVIFKDLSSFGIPILAVGDHGQLPPVSGVLNLMENPDVRLEHIHRQAEGSPIIRVSMLARLEGHIPVGVYGPGVVKHRDMTVLDRIKDPKAGIILCGTNATRVRLNAKLRGRTGLPVAGERVVCLRNDREAGIYNGSLGEIVSIEDGCPLQGQTDPINGRPLCRRGCDTHCYGEINFDGVIWSGTIVKDQFGAAKTIDEYHRVRPGQIVGGQFDFASAVTVHKFQGSEMDNVVVVEECGWMPEPERRRWMYTAVTRSRSKLVIIGK